LVAVALAAAVLEASVVVALVVVLVALVETADPVDPAKALVVAKRSNLPLLCMKALCVMAARAPRLLELATSAPSALISTSVRNVRPLDKLILLSIL
jgi:hypothetical protein